MDIIQNSALHYQRLGQIKNLTLRRMPEIQFAHLTAMETRKLKRINVQLQEYKRPMKSKNSGYKLEKEKVLKSLTVRMVG